MLDISFYTNNGQPPYTVEIAEAFYEWLAKSEFSKIGKTRKTKIKIEGEEENLELVKLGKDNRKKLRNFLLEAISEESDSVLSQLGDSPSKPEHQAATYRLKKLQELRKCLENAKYQYLQRV
ncbi:hypothetical protein [Argonema antarcticum]|uniref:hypothetical protein n=1 Tax=Argonema antarcticum TaxID=2942763 RepID=UPI002012C5BC|nr:hypothetical protein [Argonema antarcticum]MCL1475847.1 hypothetical protein [Argonema antarcticum A004/B2]